MAFSSQFLSPNADNKQREDADDEEEAPPEEQKAVVQPEEDRHHQARYVPLDLVYSATSPCSGYSNVMSKKVKAKKFVVLEDRNDAVPVDPIPKTPPPKPPVVFSYSRCRRRKRSGSSGGQSGYDTFVSNLKKDVVVEVKAENIEFEGEDGVAGSNGVLVSCSSKKKRKGSRIGQLELSKLGLGSACLDGPRLRESSRKLNNGTNDASVSSNRRRSKNNNKNSRQKKNGEDEATVIDNTKALEIDNTNTAETDNTNTSTTNTSRTKRWVRLKFDGVDPQKFVGLQCKVYWPPDADWYFGRISKYDMESFRHHVEYEDGDEERVILSKERIKFHVSPEEIKRLRLTCDLHCSDTDDLDVNEMIVLAANLDDCHEIEPGDIIWAKVTGMEQVNEGQKQKKIRTDWTNLNLTKTFLEACIQEIVQNGRQGSSLKSPSWMKIGEILQKTHKFTANRKQMRNRFDYLKAKYAAWSKLKNKTGNIYDPTTNTFNLSQEEWNIEIQADKHAESLRKAPLPFPDLCVQLFDGVVATGVDSWGPTSTIPTPVDLTNDDNVCSPAEQQKSKKKAKISKNQTNAELDEKMMKALTQIIETNNVPSIKDCKEKLTNLGWEKSNTLYKWATIIFEENGSYRESWMTMEDDECEEYIRIRGDRLGLKA